MELKTTDIQQYFSLLQPHLAQAYAPYSQFPVAALVLLRNGQYYTGINIENVSFGATNCAERTAIFSAVNAGYRKEDFVALFVTARASKPIAPCGICRQVFSEFFEPQMPIYLADEAQNYLRYTVEELVPYAFDHL